jgi:hypothetical protein
MGMLGTTARKGPVMSVLPTEDGLTVVAADDLAIDHEAAAAEDGHEQFESADSDLETLRDAFVDAFNARDLDALLALVRADVEVPDLPGREGRAALADEMEAIWERSPAAILTRAFAGGVACAVAWLPDEDGCWSRAALVCFDVERGLLSLVTLPDDPDALERAEAEEPTGEELDEWQDWAEWDRGEETVSRPRDRLRP